MRISPPLPARRPGRTTWCAGLFAASLAAAATALSGPLETPPAGGSWGTAKSVTVALPAPSPTGRLHVRSGGPHLQAAIELGVDARDAVVMGDHVFVAAGADGFVVMSLTGEQVRPLARLPVKGLALRLVLDSTTVYLLGSGGLTAIDVADPTAPRITGRYETHSAPLDFALSGTRGYLLLGRGLDVIDLAASGGPRALARHRLRANGQSLAVATDGRIFIAAGRDGLLAYDAHDPMHLLELGQYRGNAPATDVALAADRLYLASGPAGVTMFALGSSGAPRWLGSLSSGRSFDSLAIGDGIALAHSRHGGLYLLDVANPAAMDVAARLAEGCCEAGRLSGRKGYAISHRSLLLFDLASLRPRLGNEGLAFGQGVNLGGQRRVAIDGNTAYVADWFSGLHIYDLSLPKHPLLLSTFHTGGSSKGVAVRDGYAYVADDDHGLRVLDVHDRRHPTLVATVETPGLAYTPVLEGNRLYLAAHRGGVVIIDVSDPRRPELLSRVEMPGMAWSLRVRNEIVYVAADEAGMIVVDAHDPRAPKVIGRYVPGNRAEDLVLDGHIAYVAFFEGDVRILDVNEPSAPVLLARLDSPGNARGLALRDGILYVADWLAGVGIADVRDPRRAAWLGRFDTDGAAWGVGLTGDYAVVADWWGGLSILDVRDPRAPVQAGAYPRRSVIEQVAVGGQFAYMARGTGGLQVFDIQNPLNPTWATGIDLPAAHHPVLIGDRLYVARESGRIAVIDISDPVQAHPVDEIRIDHPIRVLRGRGAHLLAIGRREATLIDPAAGHRWRTEFAATINDAWMDSGQAFIATQDARLTVATIGDGLGKMFVHTLNGTARRVRTTQDRVILHMESGEIRVLSRTADLKEIGRISPEGPVEDLQTDGASLYVASDRGLMTYDMTGDPPWRIRSQVELLDHIAGITVGDTALYLSGSRTPIAIEPPPDFVVKSAGPGAEKVTIAVPRGAPPGTYDLVTDTGALVLRAAVNVEPLHFGRGPGPAPDIPSSVR
jgi:hypothetical protein